MAKFFSLGHKIIHLPTLKISSLNIDPINLDQFDAIVFTSANAIKYLKTEKQKNNIVCFCVGSITEKIARMNGFTNTISAGGTVNALKHLIINSKKIKKNKKIAYICGDNLSFDLDLDLISEGYKIEKIVNYSSEKILDINIQNKELIKNNPPHYIFVYSQRSAQSFIEIVKKYSLYPLMTGSTVMCISKKVASVFEKEKWQKIKIFNPGEELFSLKII
jgi:uroporphyrinogen-III synthase|tara:strand:- start:214 stop:870 length:657 start_codon:yes stop_codon:yes gene_type:complete